MPQKRPVLLFSFANDAKASLRLGEEQNACSKALAYVHDNGTVEYFSLGYTTLNSIYDALDRFNDRTYIFHYAGHSDAIGLQLTDTTGHSENLATIFGRQKKLKLVFLNGCANAEQVEKLWSKGVKAIIATTADVSDRRALDLADRFYQAIASGQTIREAFDTAASFVKNNSEIIIDHVFRRPKLKSPQSKIFPWRLYSQDASVLDWSINDIETETRIELMQALRQSSRERYQKFITKGGRFHHLKIDETILVGIEGVKARSTKLIEDNIQIDGKRQNLLRTLPELWKQDCTHAMLVGPGGMGKTVSLLRMWEHLLYSDQVDAPVPIFIQLNEFNNQPEKNFIRIHIQTHYVNLDLDELLKYSQLSDQGEQLPHLILLLDGYNEVTVLSNELLLEINRLRVKENYSGVQLVLTSRVDMREAHQWQAFHLLELQALTDKQIESYLAKTLPTDPSLVDVLRNPMMLSIYAQQSELPERYRNKGYLKETISSTGEMLYNVEAIQRIKIEKSFENDREEITYRRFILEHLLPFIGWEMQRAGLFFIERNSTRPEIPGLQNLLTKGLGNLLTEDFFDAFEFFDRWLDEQQFEVPPRRLFNEIIEAIARRELIVLVRDGENYRFLHQNFRDYFAARHVQNQIRIGLKKVLLPEIMRQAPLDFYVRQILGELEGEHNNQPIYLEKEKRWSIHHFNLDNVLNPLLELCRGVFHENQLGYTAWNILTILREERGDLSGADLRQLNFKRFSFNGLYISRSGLPARLAKGVLREENLFPQGHSNGVNSMAFSPNGEHIVSGSSDKTVKIWDAQTGECIATLEGHENAVNNTVFSPDGERIVSCSADKTLKIWDVQTGRCMATFWGHSGRVRSTAFSPDGRRIVSGAADTTIRIWETQTGQHLAILWGHLKEVNSTAFSPDGERIVTGSSDKTIKIWDVKTGQCIATLSGHSSSVWSTAFTFDGRCIVSGSSDNVVKIWDAKTGICLATLEGHSSTVWSTSFSPDGQRIVSGSSDKTIKIWDVQTGACLVTLVSHLNRVNSTAFSSDGRRIISGSDDKTIKIWDAQTGQCLATLEGYLGWVNSAVFSSNGRRIVSGSTDNAIKIWDAQTGQCLVTLEGQSMGNWSVAFCPGGERIISGSSDTTIKMWDAQTGAYLATLAGHSGWIRSTAFSPDGRRIVSGSDDTTIKIWDAQTGACLATLAGHSGWVRSTAFSPDGRRIISGSSDTTIKIWDAQTRECLATLEGHSSWVRSTDSSPDGRYIVSGSADKTIKIWNAKEGSCLATLEGHSTEVRSIAFSPDGRRIISGSGDTTIKIWDAQTGACLITLTGHLIEVNSVAFSPDGRHIVSGSSDKTVKIWDAQTGKCLLSILNIPGLYIQGCDFRARHPSSILSKKAIALLQQYGAIFEEEDANRWELLMETHFRINNG